MGLGGVFDNGCGKVAQAAGWGGKLAMSSVLVIHVSDLEAQGVNYHQGHMSVIWKPRGSIITRGIRSHRVGLEAPYFSAGRKAPLATSVALGYNCTAGTRNGCSRHW
jgi:hypothetical protein